MHQDNPAMALPIRWYLSHRSEEKTLGFVLCRYQIDNRIIAEVQSSKHQILTRMESTLCFKIMVNNNARTIIALFDMGACRYSVRTCSITRSLRISGVYPFLVLGRLCCLISIDSSIIMATLFHWKVVLHNLIQHNVFSSVCHITQYCR